MSFQMWWHEGGDLIASNLCFDLSSSVWDAAIEYERKRCLAICARYTSTEHVANKIAEEIKRGES